MTRKSKTEKSANEQEYLDLLKSIKEFALTVDEECPEGHRRDPRSGACLPLGSTDHTAFTRSLNNDYGPEWRGQKDKENKTFANKEAALLDAFDMDEPISCTEGTTFSFVQRKCISLEEAEVENAEEFARDEEGNPVEVADNGHQDVVSKDPEGRRDTVGFQCPDDEFFNYGRRECIPLNKTTVLASEMFSEEFKKEVTLHNTVALTSADPVDGHKHVVTLNDKGDGMSSVTLGGLVDIHPHSHEVKDFSVVAYLQPEKNYTSTHDRVTISANENAAKITTKQRKGLPDSSFGVPGKRKFPLDSCGRVRNAMARFNQGKGLSPAEKATLRRKILSRAKACGIEVKNFAKANTVAEFEALTKEMVKLEKRVMETYAADAPKKGPCPPGMEWASQDKKCFKMRGFVESVLEKADHSDIVALDPEGRRDPVGYKCPDGYIFNFGVRKCIPLDSSKKQNTQPGDTTKASNEDAQQRVLVPNPKGRPAKLPEDCPKGTIWMKSREVCIPLDSQDKIKSDFEMAKAQTNSNGKGKDKDSKGCAPGEFFNFFTKKCMPRKGSFKGKSSEVADNREGLVPPPAGRLKLPQDCPPDTIWSAFLKVCRPLSTQDKIRQGDPGPYDPKDLANMSAAQLIQLLDDIIQGQVAAGQREKSNIDAKNLPNAAFPPSLIGNTKRSLMHHTAAATDPYDSSTVDVSRLRNALARISSLEGYTAVAIEQAREHLLEHARDVVKLYLGKA